MNLSNLYTDENLINFQEDIKFLINSEIRLKILGCLYNSAASIKQIEEKTNYSYSSILDNINKLEKKKIYLQYRRKVLFI